MECRLGAGFPRRGEAPPISLSFEHVLLLPRAGGETAWDKRVSNPCFSPRFFIR